MGRQQTLEAIGTLLQLISLVLTVAVTLASQTAPLKYILTSVNMHHILSGDLEVRYKIPMTANALQVQLLEMLPGRKYPLSKVDIPQNTTSGIVIFPCGLLLKSGMAVFRLVTVAKKEILAESQPIKVLWPSITVHVPLLVETYSSDVIVQLHLTSPRCKVLRAKNYTVYADLIYEGPHLSSNGKGTSVWHEPSVVLTKELTDWLLQTAYDVTLNCEYFDRAGYYKVRIRSSLRGAPPVAESDTIHVIWSHRYSVSVTRPSVEPCNNNLKIIYRYPRCASDRDRLRVYGKLNRGEPVPPKYIFESRVHTGKYFTKLSCDLFEEEDLQEYCFSFVSTAKNGAVYELDTQCIPKALHSGAAHPTWMKWSPWSECSSSCGVGVHSRYRLCSQSKYPGSCDGKSVQTEMCNKEECPDASTPPSENFTQLPVGCSCGCAMNITGDMLLKTDLDTCDLPLYWIIQAWPAGHLVAEVRELVFPSANVMLIAREGASTLGTLIEVYSQSNGSDALYSTTNILRIEILSPNATLLKGASISIVISQSEIPRESLAMTQAVSRKARMVLSTVHVTMILLTIVLCTAAVSLVSVLYFCNARHQRRQPSIPSLCSLAQNEREKNQTQKLLTASTSTSELSDTSFLHRRSPKRQVSSPSCSPEDYLHNTFLFRSVSSLCRTNSNSEPTPTRRRTAFDPNIETQKSPTLSNVSNGTEDKITPTLKGTPKPLKSALKHRPASSLKTSLSCSDTSSPVRRRTKPSDRNARQIKRESTAPLTASLSELSITGSDDGFEYDYYDWGCHEEPGSFFCADPILVGWPPFIPQPPDDIDEECDLPLQHFTPSPSQAETEIQSNHSTCHDRSET